jgi:hypothetical protein
LSLIRDSEKGVNSSPGGVGSAMTGNKEPLF